MLIVRKTELCKTIKNDIKTLALHILCGLTERNVCLNQVLQFQGSDIDSLLLCKSKWFLKAIANIFLISLEV